MKIEFQEQKIEFVISIDGIFYRIIFKRSKSISAWRFELFDVLRNKVVFMSKADSSIWPDPEFAADIIKTFISGHAQLT